MALAVLPLLSPAQMQAPDAKPVTTDTAGGTGTPPAGRNSYIAGGNVRPAMPVNGDLYAAGGRVTLEHPVQGDATLAGGQQIQLLIMHILIAIFIEIQ